jgi:osmotically-inducible protein OsmY
MRLAIRKSALDGRPESSRSLEAKTAIEEKLKTEPGLESKDIQVTLTEKSVKLSGSVTTPDDRDKAVRIAKLYAGDREVEDQLTIQER